MYLVIELSIKRCFENFFLWLYKLFLSENIKISMLQKDKATYEFII